MAIKNTPAPRPATKIAAPKTTTPKTTVKTPAPVSTEIAESSMIEAVEKIVAPKPKVMKVNPSQSYIGFNIVGKDEKILNFRQGKKNVITCNAVKCIGANATGRRLTVTFHDAQGNQLLERKVYKEYFEKMAQTFEVELPE
jgi:hypothetical protein